MFNKTPFNFAKFNRLTTIETYFTVCIESSTSFYAQLNGVFPVKVVFDTTTDVSSQLIREYPLITNACDTATELLSKMIRERLLATQSIDTSAEFDVKVSYSHVDELRFIGDFKPGDKLVIDTKKMTVTLNGQNAIHLVDGEFFDLILGTNKLTYSDSESGRSILTRVTHRDKFLY
ncbi:phage tail family protein [Paenibacillus sp. SC116]|uniref:phage tail family protein n=1 Tax=Paenibacillus sp. SC116 TaxID=2968986 RepID=UPI00215B614C|nr:phage tail family protein [Paenibacillus sp. SC116]MCR8843070.1 phage tail family protein [Paenibacillus sp. SC116]